MMNEFINNDPSGENSTDSSINNTENQNATFSRTYTPEGEGYTGYTAREDNSNRAYQQFGYSNYGQYQNYYSPNNQSKKNKAPIIAIIGITYLVNAFASLKFLII